MKSVSLDHFPQYFRELHGRDPYSWQARLARRAVEGDWPGAIDLPTGSGKTACIDVAIFSLACQAGNERSYRSAPRRVFFCVNRRVIVDEAFERARGIAKRLWEAERVTGRNSELLARVAASLRLVAGTAKDDKTPPLDVLEVRGGIYRDNRWARSASQPTVICTTIDQLGSRLLFRGYGASEGAAPIQASLVAYDSLVLLDEAHISKPFLQTLKNVDRYLDPEKWAETSIGVRTMVVVPMTATPPPDVDPGEVIRLDEEDRKNASLDRRLKASKVARLLCVSDPTAAIVEHAGKEAAKGPAAIGVIVNRVVTAKAVYERLRAEHPQVAVELVIGAMRPIDRDKQVRRLTETVGKDRPEQTAKTSFTVATQCLEVGADYDFDVLLTECASLDAMRQRFGRLNRGGRNIEARAVIFVEDGEAKPDPLDEGEPLDPIYGNALARTWNWLWEQAGVSDAQGSALSISVEESQSKGKKQKQRLSQARTVNFGIDAFEELLSRCFPGGRIPATLLAPSASLNAPVMFPAYVDSWCQTSPTPVPDPEVSLFIHGTQDSQPDVQVCWRSDLPQTHEGAGSSWRDIVALLPPSSAECMTVPLWKARRWLVGLRTDRDSGDQLGISEPDDDRRDRRANGRADLGPKSCLLWRGVEKSIYPASPGDLRPGDTLVLAARSEGWNELGHIPLPSAACDSLAEKLDSSGSAPDDPLMRFDEAEAAYEMSRDRKALRLHWSRFGQLAGIDALKALLEAIADEDTPPSMDDLPSLLREASSSLPEGNGPLRESMEYFADNRFIPQPYPDGRGVVLLGRDRLAKGMSWFLPSLDEGDDEASQSRRSDVVTLDAHTEHVRKALESALKTIRTSVGTPTYLFAAERHDWGKTDERFQAWLRGTDRTDAWLSGGSTPKLLAKGVRQSAAERLAARRRAGVPAGFRHEMLSVQLVELAGIPSELAADRDLILHLIGAHHGFGRPFAPIADDREPPEVEYKGVTLTTGDRIDRALHRLDSGVADRFWSLTRRYGWWGLAYLESLLRLADQQASAAEDSG